ncbi:MAG TPA: metalloregulator ArsR/SmtB family transcription factor [Solirubrobacterales bacterium]|jgi:uncharacterized protein YndB with AHSA1/START domain
MANDAFKALAHPIRRDIVERLSGGTATVGEVTRDFGVSKPTISRHLKTLEEAGVVTRVIDGRSHRLALRPDTLAEASEWIESQRMRWEALFDVVGEYLEEQADRMMIEPPGYVVRIERTFDAPAEAVFDAWTSPEVMRRWFHVAPDWETPEAEVDLRVGGKVRVVMRKPDGDEVEASGEYTLIERPHRLAMTWTFDDDPSNQQQMIELWFSESEGSTTVVMVNSGISTDERRDAQHYGWDGCFDELERALAG